MNWQQIRRRIAGLKTPSAVIPVLLVIWSQIGVVSRGEYILRKAKEIAEWPYASLVMLAVGILWLGYLIARPESTRSKAEIRLENMRKLLKDAARHLRELPRGADTDTRSGEYYNVYDFVSNAFQAHINTRFAADRARESTTHEEANAPFRFEDFAADWFDAFSYRLTVDDLDFGFQMPENYAEFRKASAWPKNKRPIRPDELPAR